MTTKSLWWQHEQFPKVWTAEGLSTCIENGYQWTINSSMTRRVSHPNKAVPLLPNSCRITPQTNSRAFRNIGFHTMQVVSRRSGVNRRVRPRWSFVKPSTCSTPRTPSRLPTVSSGGRYAGGPSGTRGNHGLQTVAGSTLPSHPHKAHSPNPGNPKKRTPGPEESESNKQQRSAGPAPLPHPHSHGEYRRARSREMGANHQDACLPPARHYYIGNTLATH